MKKFLSVFLSLLVVMSIVPLSAVNVGAGVYGAFTYTVIDGGAKITECNYYYATGEIVIPSTLGGYPVTSIGDNVFYRTQITSVVIPDGVRSIGDCAFEECYELKNIVIPDSVTSIGFGAFESCYKLEGVNIPNGVKSIPFVTFYGCRGIKNIDIPDSVTVIDEMAFFGCSGLTNITIPDSVKEIGYTAFGECTGLKSIEIPNSIKTIRDTVFIKCSALESVVIPDSVTKIEFSAFDGCSALKNITIPASVTSIEKGVFANCSVLTDIYVAEANEFYSSADGILYDKTKTAIIAYPGGRTGDYVIENGVTSIGDGAFSGCTGLTSITIPEEVTSIGKSAFSGCAGLTSILIPDGITSIGDYAFSKCIELTDIIIPESVTSIGNSAFYGCDNLTIYGNPGSYAETFAKERNIPFAPENLTNLTYDVFTYNIIHGEVEITGCEKSANGAVVVPSAIDGYPVTSIGDSAFAFCSGLTSVALPDSVKEIGSNAFSYCSIESMTIPDGVTSIKGRTFESCEKLKNVIIPSSVTTIGNAAFAHCIALESITIPNSVTTIDDNAFTECEHLASIKIPDGVTSIGFWAFKNCIGLEKIIIPESVETIGTEAFMYCENLTVYGAPGSGAEDYARRNYISFAPAEGVDLTYDVFKYDLVNGNAEIIGCDTNVRGTVEIPSVIDGYPVTAIADCAFSYCDALTEVKIPDSVISIGNYAFSKCGSLKSITIPESVTSIGAAAFKSCDALTVYSVPGSYAEDFAAENGIPFKSVEAAELILTMKLATPYVVKNGERINAVVNPNGCLPQPLLVNYATVLPMRFVCETLGFEVGYDAQTNNSSVINKETGEKIVLFTGSTKMEKYDADGKLVKTFNATAPTELIQYTTHIAVRTLLEEFGYWVGWHDDGYIIVSDTQQTDQTESLIDAFNRA